MTDNKRGSKFTILALTRCGLLALLYTLLVFVLPGNKQVMHQHNLTAPEYHIALYLILLPSIAVWFVAFYGYSKLQEYAASIAKSPEAAGFRRLAAGSRWLAWSLPVSAIVSITVNSIANVAPDFHPTAIIIINYVNLVLPLVAFSLIGMASRSLFSQAKMNLSTLSSRLIMLLFLAGGVVYCYLIFRHFDPSSLGSTNNPYFLPIWLVLLTIIIPYLYAWFVGVLAAYEIVSYSRQIRGVLYKQALQLLVVGLVAVVIASIAQQYVASIQPPTGHVVINLRLIGNVIFRVIGGAGFILMALGAIKLKKIEDV